MGWRTVDGVACDVDQEGTTYRYDDDRFLIRCKVDRRLLAEIFLPTYFVRRLDGDANDALAEMLRQPRIKAMTFSRDTRPIELTALDPRTYAIVACCMRDSEIWAERAEFACAVAGLSVRKAARELGTSDDALESLTEKHIACFVGITPVKRCPQRLVAAKEISGSRRSTFRCGCCRTRQASTSRP